MNNVWTPRRAQTRTRRAVAAWQKPTSTTVAGRAVLVDVYTGTVSPVCVDAQALARTAAQGWTALQPALALEAAELLNTRPAGLRATLLASGLAAITRASAKGGRWSLRAPAADGGEAVLKGAALVLAVDGGPVDRGRVDALCAGVFPKGHVRDEVIDDEVVDEARPAARAEATVRDVRVYVPRGCGKVYGAVRDELVRLAAGRPLLDCAVVLSEARLARRTRLPAERVRADLESLVTAGALRRRTTLVDLGDHVKAFLVYGLVNLGTPTERR